MALNFNVNPYYDDFDEDKNFHRILYRPGRAVQARELTQAQTILQNQIDRFGSHIFKEGSKVEGAQTFDEEVYSVKLEPTFNGNTIDISGFEGYYVRANSTNAVYQIKKVSLQEDNDPDTIYISFIKEIGIQKQNLGLVFNANTGNAAIANSETLFVYSTVDLSDANLVSTVSSSQTEGSFRARLFSINDGVFFTNGVFVRNPSQSIIVTKYTELSNVSVGFDVVETVVSSGDDTTLLDPAVGASNYFAPGADRYKISLELSKKELIDESIPDLTTEKYIEIARYKNGVLVRDTRGANYADLLDTLARRTYDESGNYKVDGLDPKVQRENFSQNTTFSLLVSPGKAYVYGYETESIARKQLILNKSRDFESVAGYDVPSYYGNYINITTANGAIFNLGTAQRLELHSSNTNFSGNTKIAEAYVKNYEYISGNGSSAVYKLHLFDVTKTSNTSISLTKSVLGGNAASFSGVANVHNSSYFTRSTIASVVNNSPIITVSTPTSITIGMEIFGPNVTSGSFVTDVDGSRITMSNNAIGNTTAATYTFQSAYFTDINYDLSVFEASYDVIKRFSQVNYDAKRVFKSVTFTGGVASIQTNDGTERFADVSGGNLQRNYAICIRTGGTSTFATGSWVNLSSGTFITVPVPSVGSPATLDINLGDATFNGTADILTTIDITGATRRTKTLVQNAEKRFVQLDSANTHSLGFADVVDVSAIYISNSTANAANAQANTNVVDSFIFDDGQRDSYYDHATIKLRPGATVNTGNVLVIYDRFDHSGVGYFDTESYPVYDTIPVYTKRDGTTIDLRDSIDFRPIRTANVSSNIANNLSMVFNSQQIVDSLTSSVDTELEYYLSRVDKIVLNKNGQFRIVEGASALRNPPVPADEPDSMTLYTISVDPYTYTTDNVKISIAKNRRYTMKDIGLLDDRLTRVEYYTALNLLEKEIATTIYFDDQDNQLFNNGFLVDSFRGHGIGDVFNPDYKCSVDFDNEILRPRFDSNSRSLIVFSNTLTQSANLLTLPFTTTPYITQNVASGTINVNPFNVIGFIGYIKLEKSTPEWVDFSTRPDVVVNQSGDSDNFQFGQNFVGSQWGDWNILSYAQDTNLVYTYFSQSGQKVQRTTSQRIKSQDSSIIENKILQYTPDTTINFELYGMRPNTEIAIYVDDVQLTGYGKPFDSANNVYTSNTMFTDTNGYLKGQLLLPNDDYYKFTVGKKHLFFCDNRVDRKLSSTLAETYFYSANPPVKAAKPIPEPIRTEPAVTTFTGTSPSTYEPPSSQPSTKFYYDSSAPTHTTNHVIASLAAQSGGGRLGGSTDYIENYERNTGQTYVPVSSAQAISNINSASSTIDSLYRNTLGREPDFEGYNYWVSVAATGVPIATIQKAFLAEAEKNKGNCAYGYDPIAQTFFVNPFTNPNGIFVESIDVFFLTKDTTGIPVTMQIRPTVNGYPSSSQVLAQVTLNPEDVNVPTNPSNPISTRFTFDRPVYLEPGEYSFALLANSQGYNVYIATVGQDRIDTGETIVSQPYIGSLFKSQNASTWEPDQNSDITFILRQCKFTTGTTFSAVLRPNALGYSQTYDLARLNIPFEVLSPSANISFELATKANGSSTLDNYFQFVPNSETYLPNRKVFNASADANVRIRMSTTDADISPSLDVSGSNIIFVKNLIEGPASANVIAFPETLPTGGGAESKYITRRVTLNEGFDATSLRVYLQKNLPQGSSMQVFYRVQSGSDSGIFNQKPWVRMNQVNVSTTNQNINEYYDCEYKADNISYTFDGVTYNNFRTFAIKVVMFSTNPANAPTAKNLRVIALS